MIIKALDALTEIQHKVAMVDGGFDPLHQGHVRYFQEAATLGLPLLCCLAPDSYVLKKHPVLLTQDKRAYVIDALECMSYVYLSDCTTAEAIERIKPKIYVKGKDWEGRLPEKETQLCNSLGIEIVYLDTVLDSSSNLLQDFIEKIKAL